MKSRILFLFILILASCNDGAEEIGSIDGMSFFPLEIGQKSIYQVSEKIYSIDGDVSTMSYQLQEEIVDSFLSAQDSTYVIYRYTREDQNDDWEFLETWQARRNNVQAIIIEGNTPFLKMTFPIFAGKAFDGNRLNTNDEDVFVLDSVQLPFDTEALQFENTLTVIQSDNQDFIVEQDKRYEVYGSGVGLVYKSMLLLDYCTEADCLGQQIIETGREFEQSLIEYEN